MKDPYQAASDIRREEAMCQLSSDERHFLLNCLGPNTCPAHLFRDPRRLPLVRAIARAERKSELVDRGIFRRLRRRGRRTG